MTNRTGAARGPQASLATRIAMVAALAAAGLLISVPAPALAAPAKAPSKAQESAKAKKAKKAKATRTANKGAATRPAPTLPTKGPGIYSAPEWLPLRHDLDGGEITVGCTHDSHGSQHAYECGGHHSYWAIDFIATRGTPVYAAGSGFARNATGRSGSSGYGNVVRIDHGFGVESLYAHLDEVFLPPEGAWVDADTVIGIVGSTGTSSAPHLHFEKHVGGSGQEGSVDPGPLKACVLAHVVTYPQIRDQATWDHLAWGTVTVFSDGTACAEPAAQAIAAASGPTSTSIPTAPAPTTSSPAATSAIPTSNAIRDRLPIGWLLLHLANLGELLQPS